MRMHIELDDDLVRRIDAVAGSRGRDRETEEILASAGAGSRQAVASQYGFPSER